VTLVEGFDAQVCAQTRVLILGSMPGDASLLAGQYYAHPRNRFWPLMQALCGVDAGLDYPQRLQALRATGVGLWDVLAACERPGSLDASIRPGSEIVVDLPGLLPHCPQLQLIACNGKTAANLYGRHLSAPVQQLRPGLAWLTLPSTSPANAAFSLSRLQQHWQPVADALLASERARRPV
jgi:double-stranded uracil-DNA glycosylase